MGLSRTFNRSLARLAMTRRARGIAVAMCALVIGGCAAVGDITGAVAGLASGAATANPAVGISVGIAVRAGTNEALEYVARRRQRNEQDAVAIAAAELSTGESRAWAVDQRVAGDAHGEVQVIRIIETPLALCKELLFSVIRGSEGAPRATWYSTTACNNGERWNWAAAEPAVPRWITLQ